jgi:hypothetical protein
MLIPRLVFVACIFSLGEIALAAKIVTYIFGDSLTDVGNNNFLQYSLAKSNFPFYGIDYSGGQATGRFTNGRTIGDIICNFLISNFSFLFLLLKFNKLCKEKCLLLRDEYDMKCKNSVTFSCMFGKNLIG